MDKRETAKSGVFRKLARSMQISEQRRTDGPIPPKIQGVFIMSVRIENLSRNIVALVGSVFFTAILVAASAPGLPLA